MTPDALELPHIPAQEACYDRVREVAPALWDAFERQLLPLATSTAPLEQRVRDLLALGERIWTGFRADGGDRAAVALGRSWPCLVEDVVAAAVEAALPAIVDGAEPIADRRARLQALSGLLRGARPESFAITSAALDVRAAIAELG